MSVSTYVLSVMAFLGPGRKNTGLLIGKRGRLFIVLDWACLLSRQRFKSQVNDTSYQVQAGTVVQEFKYLGH